MSPKDKARMFREFYLPYHIALQSQGGRSRNPQNWSHGTVESTWNGGAIYVV